MADKQELAQKNRRNPGLADEIYLEKAVTGLETVDHRFTHHSPHALSPKRATTCDISVPGQRGSRTKPDSGDRPEQGRDVRSAAIDAPAQF